MKRMKRQLDVARDVAHALGALGAKVVFSVARHQLKRCFEGLRIGCCFGMTRKRQCGCYLSYSPDRTIEHTPVVWLGLGVVPTGLLGVIMTYCENQCVIQPASLNTTSSTEMAAKPIVGNPMGQPVPSGTTWVRWGGQGAHLGQGSLHLSGARITAAASSRCGEQPRCWEDLMFFPFQQDHPSLGAYWAKLGTLKNEFLLLNLTTFFFWELLNMLNQLLVENKKIWLLTTTFGMT